MPASRIPLEFVILEHHHRDDSTESPVAIEGERFQSCQVFDNFERLVGHLRAMQMQFLELGQVFERLEVLVAQWSG